MNRALSLVVSVVLLLLATTTTFSGAVATAVKYQNYETLKRLWTERCDMDGDGAFTVPEMMDFMWKMDRDEPPSPTQAKRVLAQIDRDGSDSVDFDEFLDAFAKKLPDDMVASTNLPEQVHIAYTGNATQMMVMWVTADPTPTSTVKFGLESGNYIYTATGSSWTYTAGDWKGMIHGVLLEGLQASPRTTYYYRVGDAIAGWSASEFHFQTAQQPLASALQEDFDVDFYSYGDMGTYMPWGAEVTKQIIKHWNNNNNNNRSAEFILHVGDLSYASTGFADEIEAIWDLWLNQIEPLAAYMPYMTTVGNHESFYNWTAYVNRFRMPPNGDGNFYWSLDYAGIHFTSMSTEMPYGPGSAQYAWLEQDLARANANRDAVPWIIVLGHRPMYSSDKATDSGDLRELVEPLFQRYNVDLVIAGHMHCYERTWPVYNNIPQADAQIEDGGTVYVNPTSPTYLVIGTAGAMILEKFDNPLPAWSAVHHTDYGFGHFHVNRTTLHFEYLTWQLDSNSKLADELYIIKN